MNELDEMYEAEERADRQKHDDKLKELKNETVDLNNKIRELEDYCKAYNFTQHELHEEIKDLKKENTELNGLVNQYKASKCGGISLVNRNMIMSDQLTKAKEIILRLYNAGRDVLMCRAEEKAYDNLSNAINDKSIEQFLSEVKK